MLSQKMNRIITFIIAVSLGCAAGLFCYLQPLYSLDQQITNWVYDHSPSTKADQRITIVTLNDTTYSRSDLAKVISELSNQNASVIGLDLDLSEEGSDTVGNAALTDACRNAGNVVTIASVKYEMQNDSAKAGTPDPDRIPNEPGTPMGLNRLPADASHRWEEQKIDSITLPFDALLSYVEIGVGNAMQESFDGFIRNAALSINYQNESYDSFAAAVYKKYQDSIGRDYQFPKLDQEDLFGFNMVWNEESYQTIAFSDVLSGAYDASLVTDSIILIGEYQHQSGSSNGFVRFFDPASQDQQEVLLQAAVIQALLTQETVNTVSIPFQAFFYSVIVAVIYLIINGRKTWITLLTCFLTTQGITVICYICNRNGFRFLLLTPTLFLTIGLILTLLQRLVLSFIERKRIEMTLKMYVEPQVVDQIAEKSPFELAHLSERRHIAVLFVDIRGFTTISESLEPEQVVEILNEYLSLVAASIQNWGGTLDKFIGDAAMAIFNAPNDLDDYVFRAVCAAYEISRNANYLQTKYNDRYGKPVTFGIGVNCGEAVVGNIGSLNRMDYTAIGDTVNTASRLEANAKAGQILISEAVLDAVGDRIETSCIGSLSLKGKKKTVETYQLDEIPCLPDSALQRKGFLNEKFVLHSKIGSNK